MEFESQLLEFSNIQLIDGDRGKNYPKHDDFTNSGDVTVHQPRLD